MADGLDMAPGRRPLAWAVLLTSALVATGGSLVGLVRAPPEPAVRIALPPPPELAVAGQPGPAHAVEASPPEPLPMDAPPAVPAMAPTLLVVVGGLAWNAELAVQADATLPAAVAFLLPLDHRDRAALAAAWRGLGREVVLAARDEAPPVDAKNGATLQPDGLVLAPGAASLTTIHIDAALLDEAGLAAALDEAAARGREHPPAAVVVEAYPARLLDLRHWLDGWLGAGHRLVQPSQLAANGER